MVFTFIMGLGFVPPQDARAASSKIDIAPSRSSVASFKASSASSASTKKAPYAVDHADHNLTANVNNFWQWGGTGGLIFPKTGTSPLWLALDLGSAQTFDEVSFDIPTNFAGVNLRMSDYEVLYTSDASTWTNLPAARNSAPSEYIRSANNWTLAKKVTVPSSVDASDPNWGSLMPSNTDWTATTNGTFATPVTARYVMIHFTLMPSTSYSLGISNLKILNTLTSPTILPASSSYVKGNGNTPLTTITLNRETLSSITMTNSVTNAVYLKPQDYNLGVISGDTQTVAFTNAFLDSLPNGGTSLTFYFSGGFTQQYNLNVRVPTYADTYLNNPGSGYAIITPNYSGMSLTIGHPAVVDANAAISKFPVFNISRALSGTSVTGTLIAPDGTTAYSFPATSVDAGGNAVVSIPDSTTLTKGTYKAAFTLTNNGNTFYDNYYFTVIDNFTNYRSTPNANNSNNANVANVNPDSWVNIAYPAIQMDASGKITYAPDYKGNQIMDYSSVGYKGGGVAIPNAPVRARISPLADNTQDAWQTIQDAIDYVSSYPIQADGIRGAVYLEPGVFRISKPLNVTTSGVVIRGAGAGTVTPVVGDGSVANPYDEQIASENAESGVTKLISTWKITTSSYTPPSDHASTAGSPYTKGSNSTLINFNGQGATTSASSFTTITDQYVGAGQSSVHVASVSDLSVGDIVTVQKAVNANWVKAMYMDKVDGASNWLPNGNLEKGFAGIPFTAERTIKKIDTATKMITFAEPLSDNLDMRWGVSRVLKTTDGGRISNVGVENIQGISHFYNTTKPLLSNRYGKSFRSYNDENHAEVFVAMVNVRDGWMRNFTTYHIDSAFVTEGNSRNITVQDGNVLDPVSLMDAGERRYSIYYKDSEHMFTQRVYSRFMRHAFIVDSYTSGPNVFYNSSSEYTSNATEPHFRWSSGGLYDNVIARIYLQNRWNMGTSHGWAGVNYLLYNFTGPFIATQPQISPNYVIGHSFDSTTNRLGSATNPDTGRQKPDRDLSDNMTSAGLNGGKVPNFEAYEYSVLQKVTPAANNMPDSLYVQQLINSHGSQASAMIAVDTVPPMVDLSGRNADLSSLTLSSGTLSPAFESGTTAYTSSVARGVSSLTVTAGVYDSNAAMTVNGIPVINGQVSGAISLNTGNNTITIVVTAGNGTTKTYSVIVYRATSSGSSSSGGGSSTPSDTKVTATDGKLTLAAGKSGEVSLSDAIVVSIPSNATDKELKLTIEKVVDTQNLLTNKEGLASSVFEILKNFPENFNNPITLTFVFDPVSLNHNQTAGVFYYDEVKKVWVEVPGSKINGNQISVEVNHFTKYAVFAVDLVAEKPIPDVNLSDITLHWAEANIKQAISNGIVTGYPDGTFKPNNTVTRAEFAVMLMNTLKPQGEGAALTFTDTVEIGTWAQKAVAQAFKSGIVQGYEDGSYRPNAEITRAEMAVMLANALGLAIEADSATGFADDKNVPAWSKSAVAAMKKQRLVEGKGDNEFAPMTPTTRAEAVTVLLNMLTQKGK
ncbi:S-layer homology domain-containing protein [Paenibacillus sp. FSL H7-0331]|uniref:S-layer homology domain-containing protein n=2 Tax=Paenibacillus sp. FSL H7-0331 TaxID=1920421 RepID=UPI0015C2F0D4|nr:S-layer homology domain-containing protein [Paenibacillus sp. FSL H7-0331]